MPRISKELYEKALAEKRVTDHEMTVETILDNMTPDQKRTFKR